MQLFKKRFVLPLMAAVGLAASMAMADVTTDAEALFNWAEGTYPAIFPVHKTTQTTGPWLFRHYPETGVYAGVNKNDNQVYVMGGPWGSTPKALAPLATLMVRVAGNGGSSEIKACDVATLPTGIIMTQTGSTITVTTGGKCIELPTDQTYCDAPLPATPVKTGISVLTTTTLTKSELKGFTSSIPGIADAFLAAGNFKSCTINMPTDEFTNVTMNMDVCYDLTSTFTKNGITSSPPLLVITPPVTQTLQASSTSQKVADCFATGADTINDLVTKEIWVKKPDGTYNKL